MSADVDAYAANLDLNIFLELKLLSNLQKETGNGLQTVSSSKINVIRLWRIGFKNCLVQELITVRRIYLDAIINYEWTPTTMLDNNINLLTHCFRLRSIVWMLAILTQWRFIITKINILNNKIIYTIYIVPAVVLIFINVFTTFRPLHVPAIFRWHLLYFRTERYIYFFNGGSLL